MRTIIIVSWLVLLFLAMGCIFWRNEWIYSLPTPIPEKYKVVNTGGTISLPSGLEFNNSKPIFLHFFNPDCPCSRFNVPHFRSLVQQYGSKVNFVIIPMSQSAVSIEEIQSRFKLDIPVLIDPQIAASCGVYSTPQAAIIDVNHTLNFRGNYNRSRYCSDPRTEYAKIALEALLNNEHKIVFDPIALRAYGCQIPLCKI